ncbi:MAG: hypothetical protein R3E89_15865 [Thiolinea sp.]
MSPDFLNLIEVILNGLMTGVMYSLVALGFVLIFKASGIFNYAQGVMALFAALTLVGFQTGQVPFSHLINAMFGTNLNHWGSGVPTFLAILLTMGVMILFAWLLERIVLKHMVNQAPIILFMTTIGLAYFMEGFGDLMWEPTSRTWMSACPPAARSGGRMSPRPGQRKVPITTACTLTCWMSGRRSLPSCWSSH